MLLDWLDAYFCCMKIKNITWFSYDIFVLWNLNFRSCRWYFWEICIAWRIYIKPSNTVSKICIRWVSFLPSLVQGEVESFAYLPFTFCYTYLLQQLAFAIYVFWNRQLCRKCIYPMFVSILLRTFINWSASHIHTYIYTG